MSKLSIDQKTILALFSDKRSDFLIPDYQRPYAWGEPELETLWEDLFGFAIPDGNADAFDTNEEYFLGPIVTFRNSDGLLEIIDGQQRLTTLMLLLRAFYAKFEHMQDADSQETKKNIGQCVWETNEFGTPKWDKLKIDSQVASDDDKDEFLSILRSGVVEPGQTSRYAQAFTFFQERISEFIEKYPSYTPYLANRTLKNVILLPIEAESQDTALRIFSTLNDRGLPLADADIFKSQFYEHFSNAGRKDDFVQRWRLLEETSNRIFSKIAKNPMDELFTRYMYYERAKKGIKDTTTASLRDFYENDSYALLKREETLSNLEALLEFWRRVGDHEGFSEEVLKQLQVLSWAPNSMWTYLTSVYFMQNRDNDGVLEETYFRKFLERITGFILAYAMERPGVNALRTPVYPEMVNIVEGRPVTFAGHRFSRRSLEEKFKSFTFSNGRPITKSMLTWWAFQHPAQGLLDPSASLHVEHIYAKKRADAERSPSSLRSLESLGNKAMLEDDVNIRASDYRFPDKKRYYEGFTDGRGRIRPGTKVTELLELAAERDDFTEGDIRDRSERIIGSFLEYLGELDLLVDDALEAGGSD